MKVFAILDPTTHGLREDVIQEVLPVDVEKIRNVPVSAAGDCDQRFCAESCARILRVRDVYKMGRRYKEEDESSSGGPRVGKTCMSLMLW